MSQADGINLLYEKPTADTKNPACPYCTIIPELPPSKVFGAMQDLFSTLEPHKKSNSVAEEP